MKLFITGSASFIGRELLRLCLERKIQVTGVDLLDSGSPNCLVADICSPKISEFIPFDTDAIIHLAALSRDNDCRDQVFKCFDLNVMGTLNLIDAAKAKGVKQFIFSSSCSSYGANENVVDEKSELSPLTAYAKSKVLAEKELLKLKDEDFSPVNLRSATAYGLSPNLRLDLVVNNLTCSAVTTGLVKLLSDGTASRPLVHVEDMARAFIQVLKSSEEKINGQVFNVGSNENNFIVKEIAKIVESIVPNSKVSFGDNVSKDSRTYNVNFDKIRNELGFRPKRKLEEGVREMYNKFIEISIDEKEFLDKKFYRLKYLKWLIEKKLVNENLEMK